MQGAEQGTDRGERELGQHSVRSWGLEKQQRQEQSVSESRAARPAVTSIVSLEI